MKRLSKIRERLRGLTPREVAAESFIRARRQMAREIGRALDNPEKSYISDEALSRALAGRAVADLIGRMRERGFPHLTRGLQDLDRTASSVKQFFPESVEQTVAEADAILAHRISIFGQSFDFGPEIDWHLDPEAGARWPRYHFSHVPLRHKPGADVRVVWELNRLHHLTTLGRAYALTNDERYAEEFLLQLASWYEENPPRYGVNWTVAMEAAIRAVNLIAAMELFLSSPLMTDEAVELMLKTLLAHGRFIRANLEISYSAPSNHYLSDLIGLFALGMTLPDFQESSAWVSYSAPRLLQELERQVLPDGVDYEGSTGYHRFALEVFALFFEMSQANRIELPGESWERLEAMFNFARHYLKPDGTAPLIGDSDDGRLIRFKGRPATDHSYLMSIAALLLESETFKQSSRIDEEAIWWFGDEGREAFDSLSVNEQPPGSQAFPDAQIFIQRASILESISVGQPDRPGVERPEEVNEESLPVPAETGEPAPVTGELYAIIDCGDHGVGGRGSHAHSDALSIEVYAYDRTFLRDPGTFVYTANARWRNLFRSTAYHNTVRVDGFDISRISDDALFTLGPNVKPQVYEWESNAERDVLDAAHYGYMSLPVPVIHRRAITFDKRAGYWMIEDLFSGSGGHELEFFFNFEAGLEVSLQSEMRAVARSASSGLAIVPISGHAFETEIVTRWVSLGYGTRARSSGIIYRLYAEVPFENVTLLIPYRAGDESKVERILETMKER